MIILPGNGLSVKNLNKTSQKIPEMGMLLEFDGEPEKLFSGNDNSINAEPGIYLDFYFQKYP